MFLDLWIIYKECAVLYGLWGWVAMDFFLNIFVGFRVPLYIFQAFGKNLLVKFCY